MTFRRSIQKKYLTSMATQDVSEAQNKLQTYHVDGGLEKLEEQSMNELGPVAGILNRDKIDKYQITKKRSSIMERLRGGCAN